MSVLTAWDLLCPLCVCVFFTSYRVKTKKFFATGSLPRFVYGSFQTDPSKEYFENRYPTRTPLKSQAQFAKKKTRKIVMNNSRSRLLNQFLIIVMVHLNPLSSFIFSTISSLKASATAVLIANPLLAKSMAGWTRSFQGNLPYSLHARNWPWTSPGTAIAKRPRKKKRYSSSTKLCQVPSRTAGKVCLEGRQVLSIPQAVVLFSSERGERRRKLCKLMAKRRRDLSGGVVSIYGTQKENKTLLAVAFTTNPFCELGEIPTITQIRTPYLLLE